ncbi:MAG: NAD-dependent epimerase/dehydratase family protein [Acidimicrobiales bacterium]|nr:NAD-dependent epimerase/dehydratase family protein [Acidimicrobiales bacterium]
MRILLTGGDTFIGSHVAAILLDAGHDLRLLTPRVSPCELALSAHGYDVDELERTDTLHLIEGDITDPRSVVKALVGCEGVVHLAAQSTPHWGRRRASAHTTEYIVTGTQNIINAALDHDTGTVSICSPVSVLAPYTRPTISPDDPTGPGETPRLQALVAADNYARLRQAGGDPITITYTATPVGPIDPQMALASQSLRTWLTRAVPVSTDARTALIDVRDLGAVLTQTATATSKPHRYLAFGHLVDLRTIADILDRVTGHRTRKVPMPRLAFDAVGLLGTTQRLAGREAHYDRQLMTTLYEWKPGDQTRIYQDFGITPRPLAETVADSISWLGANGLVSASKLGVLAGRR